MSTFGCPAMVTIPGFVPVLVVTMAAAGPRQVPAVGLDHLDGFANLHAARLSVFVSQVNRL